ncbi:ABC transporter ATP-binding protein [Goodfellowiella coeruleoviolacea]|uniref:ATP-binding cassette, subfamily B n=1 Tax=Goodfellowiella coeruleoviolacea TaxID=334858 RepID=A0AAE3KGE0_9PSEU|nr:ABC transporter ATP-binding protein [Goodfellowiella coeruleoviolacea]MCP2166070.1 ATP-binding cassette, subfamily B [Goodfellowiella coeruleoviolacea]
MITGWDRSSSGHPGDRLLWGAARHAPGWPVLVAVAGGTATAAGLLLPDAMASGVDAALAGVTATGELGWLAVVALAVVLGDVLGVLARARATSTATAWLRTSLIQHLLRLGPFGRFPEGDAVSRLTGDCAQAGGIATVAVQLVTSALTSVGAIVALALLDWRLAVVFAASVPVAARLARGHLRRTADQVAGYQRLSGELAARLVEAVRGLRTITAAGVAEQEARRVLRPLPDLHAAGAGMWHAQAGMIWRAALLLPTVELAVLTAAGFGLLAGRLTAGEVLAALGYVALGMSLVRATPLLTSLARARVSADRLAEVLDSAPPATGAARLPAGPGRLELRGVGVADVLHEVDLVVPAGAHVAVVGVSGSGKSTLAAVAGGLRTPDRGGVLLDGVALAELDPAELRAAVGYAFDQPALLGATVADAVGYGLPVDLDGVRAAGAAAQVAPAVALLPEGWHTPLERAPLSGGEAQRLGLARAIYRRPRVLVMDDATASLDTVTEARVRSAISSVLAGRTRLVITHRVSSAAEADLVVWLADGRIRAVGPHRTLWDDPGYRAVFTEAPG